MLDVTVIVGTFGDGWFDRGASTRDQAAERFPGVRVIHSHGATLADARNAGVADALTEWVAVLDADDELEPGYFDVAGPQVDVIVPRVQYIDDRNGKPAEVLRYVDGVATGFADPVWPRVVGHDHECVAGCLHGGNWIVVGAPVRRSLFERVGGFRELPIWEDWDLWRRCWQDGARFGRVEGSVYRAHVNPRGRNHGLTAAERRAVQDAIVAT